MDFNIKQNILIRSKHKFFEIENFFDEQSHKIITIPVPSTSWESS